jgi:hypothetical protein
MARWWCGRCRSDVDKRRRFSRANARPHRARGGMSRRPSGKSCAALSGAACMPHLGLRSLQPAAALSKMSVIGQLLVGWLLADLLSGIFHWWEDQFGKESWPVIGPWLIAPNRLHHAEPLGVPAEQLSRSGPAPRSWQPGSIRCALVVCRRTVGPSLHDGCRLVDHDRGALSDTRSEIGRTGPERPSRDRRDPVTQRPCASPPASSEPQLLRPDGLAQSDLRSARHLVSSGACCAKVTVIKT